MKYIYTLIALVSLSFTGFAQITWDPTPPPPARGFETTADIETHSKVTFTQAGTYRWVRDYKESCAIKTAICDKNACYLETTDSADFTVTELESFDMIAHFYPYDSCCPAGASLDLYVYKVNDPSVNSSITYTLDLWCAKLTVNDLTKSDFNLSPNPVNNVLNINTDAAVDAVTFTNLVGSTMDVPALGNNTYDVSGLTKGIYLVTITSGNQQFTKRLVKK